MWNHRVQEISWFFPFRQHLRQFLGPQLSCFYSECSTNLFVDWPPISGASRKDACRLRKLWGRAGTSLDLVVKQEIWIERMAASPVDIPRSGEPSQWVFASHRVGSWYVWGRRLLTDPVFLRCNLWGLCLRILVMWVGTKLGIPHKKAVSELSQCRSDCQQTARLDQTPQF